MNPPKPNLAQDLVRIHKVITRAIEVCQGRGAEYLKSGLPDPVELAGYGSYTHCLMTVLGAHHTSEDQITFPEIRKVLPSGPYARLAAEHHGIAQLLSWLPARILDLSIDPINAISGIHSTLQKVSNLWPPHYQLEEKVFNEQAINSLLSPEDQIRISQAASRHSQEHSEPAYWVVPFILFNLESDDRMTMASFFPPEIMGELVPVVWKEHWEPMKPLLLV